MVIPKKMLVQSIFVITEFDSSEQSFNLEFNQYDDVTIVTINVIIFVNVKVECRIIVGTIKAQWKIFFHNFCGLHAHARE